MCDCDVFYKQFKSEKQNIYEKIIFARERLIYTPDQEKGSKVLPNIQLHTIKMKICWIPRMIYKYYLYHTR